MFQHAIVRKPCKNMIKGVTTANLGVPDYEKALDQHRAYSKILQECGLKVTVLDADENFPDSTFIEDTAVLTSRVAIITNPGAPSRKGEIDVVRGTIESFYSDIETIVEPGTVDGGDIMMVGDHFYIGLSKRTNEHGAKQFIDILNTYGFSGSTVTLNDVLHLKTGVAYIENNNLIASGEFLSKSEFQKFTIMKVSDEESYAANCIWINDSVIIPTGFPGIKELIKKQGYTVIETDVSEFRKLDGGLSCLSLRF